MNGAKATDTKLTRSSFGLRLGAVVVAGAVVRVLYDAVVLDRLNLGLDSTWYFLEAGVLRHHHAFADPQVFITQRAATAAWPPLYPAFLAVVQSVFGDAARTSQLAGAVTGGATIALTGVLARRFTGVRTALLAAGLVAISPLLIAVDGSMMSETLFVPLALGTALAVVVAAQDAKWGMWVLAGALAGLATLTRVEGLLLVACVIVPAALLMKGAWARRLEAIGLVVVTVLVIVMPWVVRNASRVDSATIATVSSGTAVGGANCDATYHGRALGSWDYACTQPELQSKLSEAAWSNRNRNTGRAYATAHASHLPVVVGARIARAAGLWSPGDQADRERLETRSHRWQWLAGVAGPLVVVFGSVGLVILGRRRGGIAALVGLVATSLLVVVLGYGNTRFRSTAEPAFLIGVAVVLAAVARRLRTRHVTVPILVLAIGMPIIGPSYGAPIAAPAATTYEARRDAMILSHYERPSPVITGCSDHRGYVNYATAALWLNRSVADANNKLAAVRISHITGQNCDASIDLSRANLWLSTMLRPFFLYKVQSLHFPGRLTPAAANNLVAQMWAYAAPYSKRSQAGDPWSIFDSENHDAQAESFNLLAAQAFKNRGDYAGRTYQDGSTPLQQYQAWRAHWSNFFDQRAKQGLFIEVGSPTYHSYLVDAILNIYNFAEDPMLRKKAGMVLDLDFADYAQQQLNNIWGGAKSRSYPANSYSGEDDAMTNYGRFLFGPGPVRPKNILGLATSGYRPPPVVQTLATDRAARGSFASVTRRPGVGTPGWDTNKNWHVDKTKSVLTYSFVTPDYVMGTAALRPGDTHIAPSSQNRWQGVVFGTSPGDRVYPQAAPTSVSKTMNPFISVQDRNVLITRKQGYPTQPTLVYFPNSLDNVVEAGGWVFVQEGGAYLAVRPAAGTYHWLNAAKNKAANIDQRFIQLSTVSSPLIFEAARAAHYSSFAAFRANILDNARSYANSVLRYTASNGTMFTFFVNATPPRINGTPINYAPSMVFDSPYMRSVWNSGKVTITQGPRSAVYDFSNPANPVKTLH